MKNSSANALEFFIFRKNCFLALFTKNFQYSRIAMMQVILQTNSVFISDHTQYGFLEIEEIFVSPISS
jgi:hypothetical protein